MIDFLFFGRILDDSSQRLETPAAYWRRALAGASSLLLPTDRPRPTQQSFDGAVLEVRLDAELTRELEQLARQHDTTLDVTLLAAWAAVLSRLAGQEDVVIGVPSAHRTRREVEDLNTLARRIDLSGEPSAAELLARVRQTVLAARDHQDLPFEQLVEIVQPQGQLDRTPLFQVMFAWQGALEPMGAGFDRVKFDVELTLGEADGGIAGEFLYARALFDAATIERHRGYFVAMLRAMVADARTAVARVELLAPQERTLLLETWNATAAPYPSEQCIHTLFEDQVARTPDAIAVVQDDLALTYADLNARSNRLAHRLIALGVGPDRLVGVCAERRPDLMVGLVAILKAGGAYVPLDPTYPRERLQELVRDAAPALVLADAAGRQALDLSENVASLDEPAGWADERATNPEVPGLTSAHLAYVVYTSGSTGTPKGVMVEHRSLVNHITWQVKEFGFTANDAVLQRTSTSFDASVWELWTPLAIGARLVLLPVGVERDAAAIEETIERHQVTISQFVPSLLRLMGSRDHTRGPACDFVFSGGEVLDAALAEQARTWARRSLVNLYGPTEATIDACAWTCPSDDVRSPIPIGRPIANTRIYLLDPYKQPVPVGAVGEMYIGGAGVARGYLDRPELTEERFVVDPFSRAQGARMYKTGDLARYRSDGNIEFIGRTDHQVKVRGFRIELGEVEAVLSSFPGVRAAVATTREVAPGDTHLVGYVVAPPNAVSTNALRAYLEARLPSHMVPTELAQLDELPLSPNGKIDRKALPSPEIIRRAPPDKYIVPRTPDERILVEIWESILSVRPISVTDDFFAIGGHSLSALRIIAAIEKHLHVAVPVVQILKLRTVEAVARALRNGSMTKRPSALVPLNKGGANPPLFVIHPAGGNVLCYRELATAFRTGQPVIGVQAKGVNLDEVPSRDVVAMAEEYVAAIRTVAKEGPYHLAGWSFGTLVVVEMAKQLLAANCTIGAVFLLDAPTPSQLPGLDPLAEILLVARDVGVSFSDDEVRSLTPSVAIDILINRAEATKLFPPGFGAVFAKKIADVYEASIVAARSYVPPRTSARLTLIRVSNERQVVQEDDASGWEDYSDVPVEVFRLEATHETLLQKPAVTKLASLMTTILDAANMSSRTK